MQIMSNGWILVYETVQDDKQWLAVTNKPIQIHEVPFVSTLTNGNNFHDRNILLV